MAIDWTILDKIQSMLSSGFMDWLMPRITMLGNAGAIWIVIGAVSYTHLTLPTIVGV